MKGGETAIEYWGGGGDRRVVVVVVVMKWWGHARLWTAKSMATIGCFL